MAEALEAVPEFDTLPVPERAGAEASNAVAAPSEDVVSTGGVPPRDGGMSSGLLVGLIIGMGVLLGAVGIFLVRRKRVVRKGAK